MITIEDAAELALRQPHVVRLETRPASVEGRGEVAIRDLLRNALRMRPDRIVIGEVRGAEALDLLTALNTGHDGALSTVHANSPEDSLRRLETLALMAGVGLPHDAIREQVARGIDIVVHLARRRRLAEGGRDSRGRQGRRRGRGAREVWRRGRARSAARPPRAPEAVTLGAELGILPVALAALAGGMAAVAAREAVLAMPSVARWLTAAVDPLLRAGRRATSPPRPSGGVSGWSGRVGSSPSRCWSPAPVPRRLWRSRAPPPPHGRWRRGAPGTGAGSNEAFRLSRRRSPTRYRAGAPFARALAAAAGTLDGPPGVETARVRADLELGSSTAEALSALQDRLKSPRVDSFAAALLLSSSAAAISRGYCGAMPRRPRSEIGSRPTRARRRRRRGSRACSWWRCRPVRRCSPSSSSRGSSAGCSPTPQRACCSRSPLRCSSSASPRSGG